MKRRTLGISNGLDTKGRDPVYKVCRVSGMGVDPVKLFNTMRLVGVRGFFNRGSSRKKQVLKIEFPALE